MIVLWMIYATAIAAILGLAAALVERAAGGALRQRRWLWLTAVGLSVAIPLIVAITPSRAAVPPAGAADSVSTEPTARVDQESVVAMRIAALLASTDTKSLQRLDRPFAIGWFTLAALALAAYGAAMWAIARRRRT